MTPQKTEKSKKNDLLFVITNIAISAPLMIYYILDMPSNIFGRMIPTYFIMSIAAIFLHPRINSEKGYPLKAFKWGMSLLAIVTVGGFIIRKLIY